MPFLRLARLPRVLVEAEPRVNFTDGQRDVPVTTRVSAYIPYPTTPANLGSFAIAAASSSNPKRE